MPFLIAKTRAERAKAAAVQERQREIAERRAIRPLRALLQEQANRAATVFASTGSADAAMSTLADAESRIVQILNPVYKAVIDTVKDRFLAETKNMPVMLEIKDASGAADQLIAAWLNSYSMSKATSIANTTRRLVREAIQLGASESMGQQATARVIVQKTGGQVSRARAQVIARTETHSAAQNASLELVRGYNLPMKKVWVTVEDDRTRESHREADGQKVDIDQPFDINNQALAYPGDQNASPSETINCRCVMVYEE